MACRDSGEWVNQVVGSEIFLEQETQYRPAGAADSEQVARFIGEIEADAIQKRSRPPTDLVFPDYKSV